jgi:biopolymer transport protein ExbD
MSKVMNLLRDAGYLKIALVGLEDARSAPSPSSANASSGTAPTGQ